MSQCEIDSANRVKAIKMAIVKKEQMRTYMHESHILED